MRICQIALNRRFICAGNTNIPKEMAALQWQQYAKLRIPLSKRLKEEVRDDNSLAELETLAESVLDGMDEIPRVSLHHPECFDDLLMAHREELGALQPTDDPDIDPRLKACDPELISKIEMEIVDAGDPVSFDDIGAFAIVLNGRPTSLWTVAGLSFAKKCVNELVIWPMARPDIFTGLRSLPKGVLL
ncbi:hypothetical protein DYB32_008343 [Aphanomyces invadans]|uniref:Uncharacterized protein n=1 Tax=Aphanomyces invadans TaxID=157072 RepID=A0A418ALF6_9STRA|nr:hypothetical protein DYB32_008343 [Aphanomyces invadans]